MYFVSFVPSGLVVIVLLLLNFAALRVAAATQPVPAWWKKLLFFHFCPDHVSHFERPGEVVSVV